MAIQCYLTLSNAVLINNVTNAEEQIRRGRGGNNCNINIEVNDRPQFHVGSKVFTERELEPQFCKIIGKHSHVLPTLFKTHLHLHF